MRKLLPYLLDCKICSSRCKNKPRNHTMLELKGHYSCILLCCFTYSLLSLSPGCCIQYSRKAVMNVSGRFMINQWVLTQIVRIVNSSPNGKMIYKNIWVFPYCDVPYFSQTPCVNRIFHSAGRGGGGGLATLGISHVFLCSIWRWIILRKKGTFNQRHSCDSD